VFRNLMPVRGRLLITAAKNPPVAGEQAAPLRELIDDRLLDALLERSRDEGGGAAADR
jgi:hypothetical protein